MNVKSTHSIPQLLKQLNDKDIVLWVDDDRLCYDAPEGALNTELREQVKQRKLEIIEFIASETDSSLSFSQRRVWFLEQLEGQSAVNNLHTAWICKGPLNIEALNQAFIAIINRHQPLCTLFSSEAGIPVRVKPNKDFKFNINYVDFSEAGHSDQQQSIHDLIIEKSKQPFDLQQETLLRANLIRTAEESYVLSICQHHIAWDGWSQMLFWKELKYFYQSYSQGAGSHTLPPLSVSYKDFIDWQHINANTAEQKSSLKYWQQQLQELTPLELNTDRRRPAQTGYQGRRYPLKIDTGLTRELKKLASRFGATLQMTLLAAIEILLHRYSGQRDFAIGVPISGRDLAGSEDLIGLFINTLVIRSDIDSGIDFPELLSRVRSTSIEAYQHQNVPFEVLVDTLKPVRQLNRSPLVQVLFQLLQFDKDELSLDGIMTERLFSDQQQVQLDLEFTLREYDGQLQGGIAYSQDLFDEESIIQLGGHFTQLLKSIVDNPDQSILQFKLLDRPEYKKLMDWSNPVSNAFKQSSVVELFETLATQDPDVTAIEFKGEFLSYKQLDGKSNQLANMLLSLGAGNNSLVGLCIQRSIDMLIAILAIAKSGCACVPMDPSYPSARLEQFQKESKFNFLIYDADLPFSKDQSAVSLVNLGEIRHQIEIQPTTKPLVSVDSEQLLYVMFTSGSTGVPKAVAMPHRAIINLVNWQVKQAYVERSARTLQFSSINFDVAWQEIFTTLSSGGTLVLIDNDSRRDSRLLLNYLDKQEIDQVFFPVVALTSLVEAVPDGILPPTLKSVIVAGEQLRISDAIRQWFHGSECALHNHYGPTESHVVSSYTLNRDTATWPELPPIGRPVANVSLFVLDSMEEPCPVGVSGELYIGGDCLAIEYLHQAKITAERFVNTQRYGRLYLSGDIACWDKSGQLKYLGRKDRQLKIRGFRIEPLEVEVVLHSLSVIRQVVVNKPDTYNGLVAYCILEAQASIDWINEVKNQLYKYLPEYMVPDSFIRMEQFPLTLSGKINYPQLPLPIQDSDALAGSKPNNDLERILVGLWSEILNLKTVGINDNFFDIGGHSLLAVQLLSRIETVLGQAIPLTELFRFGSIAELAARLKHQHQHQPRLIEGGMNLEEQRRMLLHTLTWPAQRVTPGGMWLGHNLEGAKEPTFWCLPSGAYDIEELVKHLPADQPAYFCRSGWDVFGVSQQVIDMLAQQYLTELLQIKPKGPYAIGGFCQGSAIALTIAKRLQTMGHRIAISWVSEAVISDHMLPSFDGPLVLFYGRDSKLNPHRYFKAPAIGIKAQYFPNLIGIEILSGGHSLLRRPWIKPFIDQLYSLIEQAFVSSDLQSTTGKLPSAGDRRAGIASTIPTNIENNSQLYFELRLENQSDIDWLPSCSSGIFISYRWFSLSGIPLHEINGNKEISSILRKNESLTLPACLSTPGEGGRYLLEFEIVEDGIARWGNPCQHEIVVTDRPLSKVEQENQARQHLQTGMIDFDRGDFNSAIGHFGIAAKLDNLQRTELAPKLFHALIQLRQYVRAWKLIQEYPMVVIDTDSEGLLAQAKAASSVGQYGVAIGCLHKLQQLKPDRKDISLMLARAMKNNLQLEAAAEACLQAIETDSHNFASNYLLLSSIYGEMGAQDKVDQCHEDVLLLSKYNSQVNIGIGRYHFRRREWDKSIKHFRVACRMAPSNLEPYTWLAKALTKNADRKAAEKVMEDLLEYLPGHSKAFYVAGQLYADLGEYSTATELWCRSIDLDPERVEANLALAKQSIENNESDTAEYYLKQAMRQGSHLARTHILWAKLWLLRDDKSSARAASNKVRYLQPLNPQGHILAAKLHYKKERLKILNEAISLLPNNPQLRLKLGNSFQAQGMPEEALKQYIRALSINSNILHARIQAGKCLFSLGRNKQARAQLKIALAKAPKKWPIYWLLIRSLFNQRAT